MKRRPYIFSTDGAFLLDGQIPAKGGIFTLNTSTYKSLLVSFYVCILTKDTDMDSMSVSFLLRFWIWKLQIWAVLHANMLMQLPSLVAGIICYVALPSLAYRLSVKHFDRVDL